MEQTDTGVKSKVLSPEQRRALDTYLATGDITQAARAGDCSERTFKRWKSEPTFAAAMQGAQDTALDETAGLLVAASVSAVSLLRRVVEDDGEKMAHRLRAAGTLLDASLRWHELRSLSQRIQALEGAVHAKGT